MHLSTHMTTASPASAGACRRHGSDHAQPGAHNHPNGVPPSAGQNARTTKSWDFGPRTVDLGLWTLGFSLQPSRPASAVRRPVVRRPVVRRPVVPCLFRPILTNSELQTFLPGTPGSCSLTS
jgi:hypothetical protein